MLWCSWLTQRAHGINSVIYAPAYSESSKPPQLQKKPKTIASVLPQLAPLLSPAAEIYLDLRFGELPKPSRTKSG